MAGEKLKDLGFTKEIVPDYIAVKESVFPFVRFLGSQIMLTPEMRSTGEVMGLADDLGMAFAKSQMAAQPGLPGSGNVFISVKTTIRRLQQRLRAGSTNLDLSSSPLLARPSSCAAREFP